VNRRKLLEVIERENRKSKGLLSLSGYEDDFAHEEGVLEVGVNIVMFCVISIAATTFSESRIVVEGNVLRLLKRE
jgi:hypothetical protein